MNFIHCFLLLSDFSFEHNFFFFHLYIYFLSHLLTWHYHEITRSTNELSNAVYFIRKILFFIVVNYIFYG